MARQANNTASSLESATRAIVRQEISNFFTTFFTGSAVMAVARRTRGPGRVTAKRAGRKARATKSTTN